MKASIPARIGSAVVAFLLLSPAVRATTFDERLDAAEEIRTSDPVRFGKLVDGMEDDRADATIQQWQRLRVLIDYRRLFEGDYEAAIGDAVELYDKAVTPEIRYRAALVVANTAAITRDYSVGLRYLERALAMSDADIDARTRSQGYGVAAILYNQFSQYRLGKHYADLWLSTAGDARGTCYARQVQIEALNGIGAQLDEAADIQPAIAQCVAAREPIGSSLIRSTLAQRWARSGKTAAAIELLKSTLPDAEATGYTRLIGELKGLLAQYQYDAGDIANAEANASYVASIKGQDPRWLPAVTAHHVLYRIALDRRDFERALNEYRTYAEADKARLDDIKTREYAFQLSRHELNQKNQSIQLLKSQNQLLLLQQKAARASAWNTRLAIALLLVLVASVGYWGWRARRMHGSLRTLADTDGLTGLANRRHFRERSEAALVACAQRRRPACVLLFDLDHFKQINDQCGHSSGDWVLREVARVGRMHCREQDLFGRIGGEEFAMTLVDCDAEAALRTAEACRRAFAAIDASTAGCGQPVSASIGVVSTVASGYEYEALIAHADAAMYRSKVAGRNRVTLYERPPVPQPGLAPALDRRNAEAMLKQY